MATNVVMEALSPTMEEGRIVKWHKHAGDPVRAGETLAEVETDKAVMDLVARADGVLGDLRAAEGQTVPVGSVVAVIAAPGERPATAAAAGPAPAARAGPRDTSSVPAPAVPATAMAPSATSADAQRVKASPLARRIAKEAGVDLQLVMGSGPGGRVVKRDLEAAASRPAALAPSAAVAAPAGAAPAAAVPPPSSGRVRTPDGVPYDDVPLTQIRKTIARRLVTSLGPVPHFFLTTEVDMERSAEARTALNQQLADEDRVSFNDLILKATALALTRHRACNAWFQDDHIRYWNEVHLGMAVAIEDGLITPVIRHADLRSLAEIGRAARELAARARTRRLQPDEYTGSTFSVSNLGMFEIDEFTAVINPPEAGILAVGAVTAKPAVVDGQMAPRRRLRLTMSCAHRVIDGATGAAFLRTLKQMLENPLAMLL
ncbi:MAG TPA: dihydrolipoamide acetyltransferase family protein [Gemmatimonadales bacterium]|nr:dihydrolipoamide acetyltransferase family protein [Gemmatimonadales bacterium]